jgi:hypothetical protein
MKILKIIILILSIVLTSCQKEDILPTIKSDEVKYKTKQWLDAPDGYANFLQIDYDNDGNDDIIQFDGYNIKVEYKWPGPQFYSGSPLIKSYPIVDNTKIFGSKLISADFDGNGYKDIFVQSGMDPAGTDWNTCWYCDPIIPNNIMFNQNGKSFKVKELSEWVGIWRSTSAADIDNDGDVDLLIFTTHQGKGLYNKLLINDGKGNFSVRKSDIDKIEWVDASEMADINRDGFVDLIVNDVVATGNRFRILWGDGNNFTQSNSVRIDIPNNMWLLDIDTYDFDRDGFDEIVVAMNYPNGGWKLQIFKTLDNKNYINISNEIIENTTNPMAYSHMIDIGDIDGNGKMDVYVNDKSRNIRWEFDKSLIKK